MPYLKNVMNTTKEEATFWSDIHKMWRKDNKDWRYRKIQARLA